MQSDTNLWLWLGPYIVLVLFMVYAMMEFTVSLLVKHPLPNRRPIAAADLRARILALIAKESPDDQIASSANALEFHWQESAESRERFFKAKRSKTYRLHILLDEEHHELCLCESSSSSVYFVGLYQWWPRLSAFAGYSAGPPGMTPNIQQIMAVTLKGGWIFRPVILPFQTTERGSKFLRDLTPAPLRTLSSTLFWGILYSVSFFLAFAWLFTFGGPELRTLHNFLVFLLFGIAWWVIWGLIAWGVCGFPQFWRHKD